MVVDHSIPTDTVPSSQPDDNNIVTYRWPSPARIDDTPPPLARKLPDTLLNNKGKIVLDLLKPFFADSDKWKTADFSTFSLLELEALPEIALTNTLDHGISILKLKGRFLNV